jgi:TrmH family RNA methyltransferase
MSQQAITSIKDPRIIEARQLTSVAGRERLRKCLLEGEKVITWALTTHAPIEWVFFHAKIANHPFLTKLKEEQIDCFAVSEGILKKISDTRYLSPFIGVGRLREDYENQEPLNNFVIVLDDVRDHGNIGTIIRTVRAFGIRDIITTRQDVDFWYKKIIEASRRKIFDIRLERFRSPQETVSFLQRQGFQVIATSPHAPLLQPAVQLQPKPIALVVGNETTGVSDEILQNADLVVQIPMSNQVESLNVGVATGISVYEFKLKLVLTMFTQYIRTTLGREVNVTGKLIQMAFDKRLKEITAFSSTQVILLMILKCDETMTLQQVSKDTATFGEELQELLQPLLDGGYIRYYEEMSPATIQLTNSGEQLLGQLWGVIESAEESVLHGFTDEEKKRFTEYLHRVQTNCEQIIG